MMQRSASAPQPARPRRSDRSTPTLGIFAPDPELGIPAIRACPSAMLQRLCSCSASSGSSTPTESTAAATWLTAATLSEDLPTFVRELLDMAARPERPVASQMDMPAVSRTPPVPVTDIIPYTPAPPSPLPIVEDDHRPKPEEKADPVQAPTSSKKVLGTGPGTCMVCLEDCDDVLGSAWLHRPATSAPSTGGDGGDRETAVDCEVLACVACLQSYFTAIVEAGFDGACPRMRCMCCPRVVCERAWAPLVEDSVLETFQQRAATLLSIQCGMCHSRGSIMVTPPSEHCYSSALDKLMAKIASGSASTAAAAITTDNEEDGAKSSSGNYSNKNSVASTIPRTHLAGSFRAVLELYMSGYEIDASPCYIALEARPEIRDVEQEGRDEIMALLLNCIEDSERRASLHLRFIRSNPMAVTRCCKALHCFRCRVIGGHQPLTCEQYEAQRGHEDVCKCPGCGVYVVKGDGCDSITCICGHNFSWSHLVSSRHLRVANAFRDAYPEDTARIAAQIIRRGRPAATVPSFYDQRDIEDQRQQGREHPPETVAAAVSGTEGRGDEQGERSEEERTGRVEAWALSSEAVEAGAEEHDAVRAPGPAHEPVSRQDPVLELEPAANDGWGQQVVPGIGQETGAAVEGWQPVQAPVQELVGELAQEPAPELNLEPFQRTGQNVVEEEEEEEEEDWGLPIPSGRLSAEDELRLANTYAEVYSREFAQARAAIYGEENPHFTVQRARVQGAHAPASSMSIYFGRPRPLPTDEVSEAEARWRTAAAEDWLVENRAAEDAVRQREAAARCSLVEAFYGDDTCLTRNTAIIHTAAEHTRAALRVAAPLIGYATSANRPRSFWGRLKQYQQQQLDGEEGGDSLFKWLGIVEPPPPAALPPGGGNGFSLGGDTDTAAEEDEGLWEMPFADAEIEEDNIEVLPPPRVLFAPRPTSGPGRVVPSRPPRGAGGPDPATRLVSAISTFGTINIRANVERWVAGSAARQHALRRLMAVEERELSKAWVALCGRRLRLDPDSKAWVDANANGDPAVLAAARRVVFLEAHPEQACGEHGAMMKAFVRRNGEAIAKAAAQAKAELVAAWERRYAADSAVTSCLSAETPASACASKFDRTYAAYREHVETRASAAVVADSASPKSRTDMTLQLRRADRMADAWASENHRRICARRFADRFVGAPAVARDGREVGPERQQRRWENEGVTQKATALMETTDITTRTNAAFAAVVALVVAPMLIGRSPLMCDCDLETILSDAVDWVSFNAEEFEEEFERMEARLTLSSMMVAGEDKEGEEGAEGGMGRMVEGCECEHRESSTYSCSRLVACPIVIRRILKVHQPVCSECIDAFDESIFNLFE